MNLKGQVSGYDFLFGLIAFLIIFASLRYLWLENFNAALIQQNLSQMEFEANRAVDSMLRFSGTPTDWNASTVEFIGLAKKGKPNVLDDKKLLLFSSLPYSQSRQLLQIDFNYFFELDSSNNSFDLNVGQTVIPYGANVISVQRIVSYKNSEAIVRFKVFE